MASNLSIFSCDIRSVDGLFSLNDLHKASGGQKNHQPAFFVRNKQTQNLITEIQSENLQTAINVINGGINRGTYVCKELVIAYGMWISAKFHLAVIRAFDQMYGGGVVEDTPISQEQFEMLSRLIKGKANKLPGGFGRSVQTQIWSQLHKAYGVKSGHDLPVREFDSARQFIASYAIEGEYLPAAEKPLDDNFTANAEAILMFNRVACHRWRELEQLTERHTELMKKQRQLLEEQEEVNQRISKLSADLYDPIFEPSHRLHILTCGVQMNHGKVKQFIDMQDKARRY